jgi:hypothetical protein
MATPSRPMGPRAALRGIGLTVLLGLTVLTVGAGIAAVLVWLMP